MDIQKLYILIHALGLDRDSQPYRNHFVTGPGSKDYHNCMSLVERGYMVHYRSLDGPTGGNDYFTVTVKGMEIVMNYELKGGK